MSIPTHPAELGVMSVFDTRLVIVAGKGGVGKTTVSAVLARAAADAGRRVLLVELDGKPALAGLVPRPRGASRSPPLTRSRSTCTSTASG